MVMQTTAGTERSSGPGAVKGRDLSKLPQWARNEIERLRADIDYANRKIAALTGQEPSSIEVEPHGHYHGTPRRFLRNQDTVRFHLNGGMDHIDISLQQGKVEVIGNDSVCIFPRASNLVQLTVDRTRD